MTGQMAAVGGLRRVQTNGQLNLKRTFYTRIVVHSEPIAQTR
jgi:hypothetical protein